MLHCAFCSKKSVTAPAKRKVFSEYIVKGGAIGAGDLRGVDAGIQVGGVEGARREEEEGVPDGNQSVEPLALTGVACGPPPRGISPSFSAKLVHSRGHAFLVGSTA